MSTKKIKGWKYYNHAMVPTCAPHVVPDLMSISDGSIWNGGEGALYFAMYTTDFDCKQETGYWYIVKEGPFEIDTLDKKYKKHILRALDRSEAKRIDPVQYAEEIWSVYEAAYKTYENADNEMNKQEFMNYLQNSKEEWWGAFSRDTGQMAGWMTCANNGDYTETKRAKYHPELQSYNRPSDTLHYAVLTYYLNELHQRYVCSGTRNINHKTHVQDYKIKNWKFRRAYCKLHIIYNPKIKWLVKCLYPFRRCLLVFDQVTIIHQVNSLLRMEEIARGT